MRPTVTNTFALEQARAMLRAVQPQDVTTLRVGDIFCTEYNGVGRVETASAKGTKITARYLDAERGGFDALLPVETKLRRRSTFPGCPSEKRRDEVRIMTWAFVELLNEAFKPATEGVTV